MKREASTAETAHGTPGDNIRAVRKRLGLTLSTVSQRTGLAVSTLSKLEMGQISLSYDKLMALSRALQVDMAELLEASPHAKSTQASGQGRRVIQRAGEGQLVETRSYKQLYMATELLHKQFIPIVVELRARSLSEFLDEFGALIRHPGEEYIYVLEGEVEFHSELYAPARLLAGDSLYFDSEMGHAYLKASDSVCRIVASCAHRGKDEPMIQTFMSASDRHAASSLPAKGADAPACARRKK
jgi:transcriptional regulator with XRE-family HTH domain